MDKLKYSVDKLIFSENNDVSGRSEQTIEFETNPLDETVSIDIYPVDDRTYHPFSLTLEEAITLKDYLEEFISKRSGQ